MLGCIVSFDCAAALVTAALGTASFSMCGLYCNHADLSPRYAPFLLGMTNTVGALPGIIGEPLPSVLQLPRACPCTRFDTRLGGQVYVCPKSPRRQALCDPAAWCVAVANHAAGTSMVLLCMALVAWSCMSVLVCKGTCLRCVGVAVTGALLDATGSWEWALFAPSILFFVTGTAVFVHYGRSEQQQFDNDTQFW